MVVSSTRNGAARNVWAFGGLAVVASDAVSNRAIERKGFTWEFTLPFANLASPDSSGSLLLLESNHRVRAAFDMNRVHKANVL